MKSSHYQPGHDPFRKTEDADDYETREQDAPPAETPTEPRKLIIDENNPPGPIQVKRINKAFSAVAWHARSVVEVSGIVGASDSETRSTITALFSGEVTNPHALELLDAIVERFGTVSKTNAADIHKALQVANVEAQKTIPEVDKRRTPEAVQEQHAATATRDEERAERTANRDAALALIMAKRPPNACALIVAELDESTSDMMTDYHGHTTSRTVAIGWRTGKRESFPQLRKAAAAFEPTGHLGTGCDQWSAWAYVDEDRGPDFLRQRSFLEHCTGETVRATTEENLRALADERIEQDTAIDAGSKVLQWGDFADLYGYTVERTSVEHRENYSMGGGNFLKAGFRDSSGWTVKSYPIGIGGSLAWAPCSTVEDRLPGDTRTAPQDEPEWTCACGGENMERNTCRRCGEPEPIDDEPTLYAEALAAGLVVDNHESDLYLRDTPEARAMVKRHKLTCTSFRDMRDGGQLLDVPAAFDPFWPG